ncbi:MAG: Flp family type IVb pilin [Ardenticatenaceae bacterium]|nr:Flp family type IVb pilin [Ardenticatenaceae bacterium]
MLQMLTVYLRQYLAREEGQDLIEYALLALLISLAAVAAITAVGAGVNTVFNNIVGALGT